MKQAECASRDDKLPIVLLHQDQQHYENAVCLIQLGGFAVMVETLDKMGRKAGWRCKLFCVNVPKDKVCLYRVDSSVYS